jgi:hypothetical protein
MLTKSSKFSPEYANYQTLPGNFPPGSHDPNFPRTARAVARTTVNQASLLHLTAMLAAPLRLPRQATPPSHNTRDEL